MWPFKRASAPGSPAVPTPPVVRGHQQPLSGWALLAATTLAGVLSPSAAPAQTITAGALHTCYLTAAGGVKCWGANTDGQLGNGTTTGQKSPVDVIGLSTGVVAIAAGRYHTCAVTTARTAKCWGDNLYGQLGIGTDTGTRLSPVDVSGLSNVVGIAAGDNHTCAVTGTGGVWCWGRRSSGQIGDGTCWTGTGDEPKPRTTAGQVGFGLPAANWVTAGSDHTCALTSSGSAYCWGSNVDGQVGDGMTSECEFPYLPLPAYGYLMITGGSDHTCAIVSSNVAACWGYNYYGQLGTGDTTDLTEPTKAVKYGANLSTMTGVQAISAGPASSHSCAVTTGGAVKCWGRNLDGQLGNGNATSQNRAVDVVGLSSGAADTALGYSHTCAVMTSGAVKCWGANGSGQLGTGTTSPSLTPVDVIGLGPFFTDDPLRAGSTVVKAVHVTELRAAVTTLRTRYALTAFTWTDPQLAAGTTSVKAAHLTDLRAALAAVYTVAGRTAPTYSHATLTGGTTVITAVDIAELRAAIKAIW
jgi:alpha-tubulin suppressor-like RCC1 family protein